MIQNGKVVDLIYVLKDSKGEQLDVSTGDDPFVYLHGSQQIVPGLESALTGLKVGDKKQVVVAPEDGYGVSSPNLMMNVKRDQFPEDVELQEGMQFQVKTDQGESLIFTVEGFENGEVKVNGNHPLADQTLHFDVEVIGVRDATEEEVAHGHAHGPHGHGHDHDHEHGEDCDHDHDNTLGHDHGDHGHVHGEDCNH